MICVDSVSIFGATWIGKYLHILELRERDRRTDTKLGTNRMYKHIETFMACYYFI